MCFFYTILTLSLIVLFSIWLKSGRSPLCWCLSWEKACSFSQAEDVACHHSETSSDFLLSLESLVPSSFTVSLEFPLFRLSFSLLWFLSFRLTWQALPCLHLHQRSECLPMLIFPISCLHLLLKVNHIQTLRFISLHVHVPSLRAQTNHHHQWHIARSSVT